MKIKQSGYHGVLFIFACLMFISGPAAAQHSKFHEMSHQEIDSVLREVSTSELTISEKINVFSEYFLGMPYNLTCVGDGPYAMLETWPLVNFRETNCMAFCEHVLALSISDYWDNFFNNLQHIRYIDGFIGMKTRNHYTMADWLPENAWILDDVSALVGQDYTQQVTRTISHHKFFTGKGIKDLRDVKPNRTITINYVPVEYLDEIKENTRTGDILALIYKNLDNIFSAHMLMVAEKDGIKLIRESSNSKMTAFDTPYGDWVKNIRENYADRYAGVSFMRVRKELDIPGKIIKPWDIETIKARLEK